MGFSGLRVAASPGLPFPTPSIRLFLSLHIFYTSPTLLFMLLCNTPPPPYCLYCCRWATAVDSALGDLLNMFLVNTLADAQKLRALANRAGVQRWGGWCRGKGREAEQAGARAQRLGG